MRGRRRAGARDPRAPEPARAPCVAAPGSPRRAWSPAWFPACPRPGPEEAAEPISSRAAARIPTPTGTPRAAPALRSRSHASSARASRPAGRDAAEDHGMLGAGGAGHVSRLAAKSEVGEERERERLLDARRDAQLVEPLDADALE